MTSETEDVDISCMWKGCSKSRATESLFCKSHTVVPEKSGLSSWVKDLPYAVGSGVAGSVVYDVLKIFADTAMFNDAGAKSVGRMLTQLGDPTQTNIGLTNFANFVDGLPDPYFSQQIGKRFEHSASSDLFTSIMKK